MIRPIGLAAIAVALLGAQPNFAPVPIQTPPGMPHVPAASVDATFAIAAMQGNNAELDAARVAVSRSSTDGVLAFARLMLTDHGDIALDGATLIKKHLSHPPAELAPPDALAVHSLREVAPVDFDQQYALLQIADHLATQAAFETEARDGTDPKLRAFAAKWLPTIGAHLQLAVTLVKHVGGDTPFKH